MSKDLQKRHAIAVKKRDKWARRVIELETLIVGSAQKSEASTPLLAVSPMRGVCAVVARDLGMSYQHVQEVSKGNRTSARVYEALRREISRRSAEQESGA